MIHKTTPNLSEGPWAITKEMIQNPDDSFNFYTELYDCKASSWLFVTHGIGEHLGRHLYLLDLLKGHYNIIFYDLRGHGQSQGPRGDIDKFQHYSEDMAFLLQHFQKKYSIMRLVLLGHSMGALITAFFMQQFSSFSSSVSQDDSFLYPEIVFLSSPPAGLGGPLALVANGMPLGVSQILSGFQKGLNVPGLVDLKKLSHDPSVAIAFKEDPLTLKKLNTRLLFGLLETSKLVFSRPLRIKTKVFCTVGEEDKIVSVPALLEYVSLVDKSVHFKMFKGGYHELHLEIEKYREPYFKFLKSCLVEEKAP